MMKVAYSLYELIGKQSKKARKGSLLKFAFTDDCVGYADCHPWEELGDVALDKQLQKLSQHDFTPLTTNALQIALCDAKGRLQQRSLFDGLTIPKSHYLIPSIQTYNPDEISTALEQGFNHFKIKLGSHLAEEIPSLKRVLEQFSEHIKLRLDFNLKLNQQQFADVVRELNPWKKSIDFYEDPFPFDMRSWSSLQRDGYNLAADYHSERAFDTASVIVLKPAVQKLSLFFAERSRLVVTSYLDHPLGQLSAAFVAGSLSKVDISGLLSHLVYLPNPFSEQLTQQGPEFRVPEGTGLGFNALLEKQDWKWL